MAPVHPKLLNRIKTLPEKPPVVLMTAFGNTEAAVEAMKLGAFYYVTKPFKLEELRLLLDRAMTDGSLKKENESLNEIVKYAGPARSMIGKSNPMKALFELIDRVSKTKTNILITGESGTGKELVARAIHYGGLLKNKPFVAVNCGAIPETLIESELFGHKRGSFTGSVADKDGLFQGRRQRHPFFLDEVGELPMSMQVKLLRVLQDKTFRPVGSTDDMKVEVRVISATNRNLEEAIVKGTFRRGSLLPAQRHQHQDPAALAQTRKDDIPEMIDHFLRKFSLGMGKSRSPASRMGRHCGPFHAAYDFPGNVRELENIMERAVALEGGAEISVESLPPGLQKAAEAAPANAPRIDSAEIISGRPTGPGRAAQGLGECRHGACARSGQSREARRRS